MYLVTILKTEIQTNAYPVNLASDGLAGMMPVFKRKRDAIKCAKNSKGAQVLEIAKVHP
jgi:hypothetical protein